MLLLHKESSHPEWLYFTALCKYLAQWGLSPPQIMLCHRHSCQFTEQAYRTTLAGLYLGLCELPWKNDHGCNLFLSVADYWLRLWGWFLVIREEPKLVLISIVSLVLVVLCTLKIRCYVRLPLTKQEIFYTSCFLLFFLYVSPRAFKIIYKCRNVFWGCNVEITRHFKKINTFFFPFRWMETLDYFL